MVGDEDLGAEGEGGGGGLFGRHGVGEVAGEEGEVDIAEGGHLGDVFGVAGDVDAEAAEGEDVAVVAALGVEFEAFGFSTENQPLHEAKEDRSYRWCTASRMR